jgi:hypothetical protein
VISSLLRNLAKAGCCGQRAWDVAAALWATDRWSTFPKYAETSAFCEGMLRGWGLSTQRIGFPADGKTKFADWTMPLAWDVRDARLELAGPAPRVLADYRETPQCLAMWSSPTPPAGVTGELLCLQRGNPEELAGLDVRGEILFTPRHPTEIKAAAARAGALGVISDWTRAKGLPHARQWINTWSDAPGGWAMHADDSRLWGFTLTPDTGERLRREAAESARPLSVNARVDSRLYEGSLHYVTAAVPGGTPEEVLLTAHINEQGANDNAAGAAVVLEAIRTLSAAIESGTLARPRRGIRVLLMPESYGTSAFTIHHREALRRAVAALNVDSGAGLYDHDDSLLRFYANPHCCPNYADAVLTGITRSFYEEQGRADRWRLEPYTLAGDNFFCDPLIGVPNPWLAMGDGGDFWHNSLDVPERVDRRSLRDLCQVVAAFAYFTAAASTDEVRSFAESTRAALPALLQQHLRFPTDPLLPIAAAQFADAHLIPSRTCTGALTLDGVPVERWGSIRSSPRWWGPQLAAWWWTDGTRSMGEIAARVEQELGAPPEELPALFHTLADLGYVTFGD